MSANLLVVALVVLAFALLCLLSWIERRSEQSPRKHKADQAANIIHSNHVSTQGASESRVWLVPTDPQHYAKAFIPPAGEKGQ